MSDRQTFTRAVYDHFTARPHIEVNAIELERIGGRMAWRTRVANARALLKAEGKGDIQNRQERHKDAQGRVWTASWYRFVPATPADDWQPVTFTPEGQATFL